jgi:predicted SnoaL-like aldol condensation-catalyzing enzyme
MTEVANSTDVSRCRALLAAAILVLGGSMTNQVNAAADSAAARPLVDAFVIQFYVHRDVPGAFSAFVASQYIQHNPGLPDGRAAAVSALAPMFSMPGAQFDVKHVLVDGNFALIHLFGRGNPATRGAAVFDLYRLQDKHIVEHWDVIQPIGDTGDPLAGETQPASTSHDTAANRKVMKDFIETLYERKQVARAYETYVSPSFRDHNPGRSGGRKAAIAELTALFESPDSAFEVKHVLVDGDFAAIHYHGRTGSHSPGAAVMELFRLSEGKIVEHWDAFQPIPADAKNTHPMF